MTAYRTRGGTISGQRMPSFSTLICDAKDCERRDERGALRGDSATVLRKSARERGWARVEGKDYCPEHVCPHGYVPGDHHYDSSCADRTPEGDALETKAQRKNRANGICEISAACEADHHYAICPHWYSDREAGR